MASSEVARVGTMEGWIPILLCPPEGMMLPVVTADAFGGVRGPDSLLDEQFT